MTVTNTSNAPVRRWAVSFALPAGCHAYGQGTGFDITPEPRAAGELPALFEVDCLGDVYTCAATWHLAPGAQASLLITVHGPDPAVRPCGPQQLNVLS
ncbi:hypothetical protein [Streptomyces sp. YIM S03343]